MALENLIVNAANGEDYECTLKFLDESCYSSDIDFSVMRRHLPLLFDAKPALKRVTSVRTVCDAMNSSSDAMNSSSAVLSEVHKLLRLYLTVPISSSTSERTFLL